MKTQGTGKKRFLALTVCVLVTGFNSCGSDDDHNYRSEPGACVKKSLQLAGSVTYDGQVKAFLASKCSSCHSPTGKRSPDLTSYDKAVAGADAALVEIKAGRMPQGGKLSTSEIQLFEDWVKGGTPKSASGASPSATPKAGSEPAATATPAPAATATPIPSSSDATNGC